MCSKDNAVSALVVLCNIILTKRLISAPDPLTYRLQARCGMWEPVISSCCKLLQCEEDIAKKKTSEAGCVGGKPTQKDKTEQTAFQGCCSIFSYFCFHKFLFSVHNGKKAQA